MTVALATLALLGLVSCGGGGDGSAVPTPTASPTPTATPSPAVSPSPTSVPVSGVGRGWTVALWDDRGSGRDRLLLVDPDGDTREIAGWDQRDPSVYTLLDWSPSGDAVLVVAMDSRAERREVQLVDVDDGAMRTLGGVDAVDDISAGFTRPAGSNLVLWRQNGDHERLDRVAPDGTVIAELYAGPRPDRWPWRTRWLYGQDGTQVVLSAGGGLRVITNTGALMADLPVPGHGCVPTRWWDEGAVLATCLDTEPERATYGRLWVVPLAGAAPTPLTRPAPSDVMVVDFGFQSAWRMAGRTFVQWSGDCGAAAVHELATDGSTHPVDFGGLGADLTGVAGDRLFAMTTAGCDTPGSLVSRSILGGDLRVLVEGRSDAGVVGAVTWSESGA